ncbi:MAG: tRNA pseudouridine(54/55) synthase Pus10 [Euryarchaeota archaeon]|nr:tRNA pseudouridine(54/55) synthase Pus10 [Euryarchaeota archaeon]
MPSKEFRVSPELEKTEVIETARKIVKEGLGPICDNCIGRQFAKISSGLSNAKRGQIVKEALRTKWNLGEEIELQGKCWVCNGLFENLDEWVLKALDALRGYEFDSFLVGTKVSGMLLENEELIWEIAGASYAEPLKAELNREIGKRIERETGKTVDFERPDLVVLLNLWTEKVELQVNSCFIYGRYRKFERGIPQTRWLCRECRGRGCEKCNYTGKMYAESVEELISNSILAEFKGEYMVLHGCGREDIDARMLGSGRPFVVEIKEPRRRKVDLRMLEDKVKEENAGKLEVTGLQYVKREMVAQIKNAKADKTYRVGVRLKPLHGLRGHGAEPHRPKVLEKDLKNALNTLTGAVIEQRTPTRVLHRRADMVRRRKVHSAKLISFDESVFFMEIRCDGGLYVKELVSGDGGRTKPNLSELLGTEVDAEVKELDVMDVFYNCN